MLACITQACLLLRSGNFHGIAGSIHWQMCAMPPLSNGTICVQGRTITRRRDANGEETADDELHNMQGADTNTFHNEWSAQAAGNLIPQYGFPGYSSAGQRVPDRRRLFM